MNQVITKIIERNHENSVSIQLGNNKLRYCHEKRWILENSDLDIAAQEIVLLTTENEKLQHELLLKEQECQELEAKLKEAQELNEISLAILADERKQTLLLKREVSAYQDELQKCFKQIVELRSDQEDDS